MESPLQSNVYPHKPTHQLTNPHDLFTIGIDVGSSSIKSVLMRIPSDLDHTGMTVLQSDLSRIRKRDIRVAVEQSYQNVLRGGGLSQKDIVYITTTGEGDMIEFRRGHFYSMTCHARGGLFLNPQARAVVDVGALHARALLMDSRSKVLNYRMTSQCASGSGQFLENIARYLGITMEDVGPLSLAAEQSETVSGICAVLAETDVINMVSRGLPVGSILKGIHLSMGGRLIKLLRALKTEGTVLVTGGLAQDSGLIGAMQELAIQEKMSVNIVAHEQSVMAGAIGAAIWGGFRHIKLLARNHGEQLPDDTMDVQ